ncbi:MAG: lipoprotein insertase outer membrane protein LolB [Sulfuricella sp.]|nr:lipoprotein insertase outer membrane protein LolB [Sulfuricella sp.]
MARRFAVFLVPLLLWGCAELPVPPEEREAPSAPPAAEAGGAFRLAGRIGVKHDGESFSGSLRWRHNAEDDEIFILSPLGQGIARIVRNAGGVALETAEGRTYHAEDVETLTEEVLGWRLPARGLQYWVAGRAAPDTPAEGATGSDQRLLHLNQGGWRIEYQGYRTVQGVVLPAKLEMLAEDRRLEVRLVIDSWVLP